MLKINQNPTIVSTILFDLETTGIDGLLINPLSVERVVIYYIERNFGKINDKSYEIKHYNPILEKNVIDAKKLVCENPLPENISKLSLAKMQLDTSVIKHNFYFNEAMPIYTLAGKEVLKTLIKTEKIGLYQLKWDATGNREGDYFITWSWVPIKDQPVLVAHQMFRLESVKGKNTYLPTRHTQENKYEILLDRYTPKIYKHKITNADLTPLVIGRLHGCVAKGFTQLEDMANQLMDIYDANSTHEAILPLLANMFNLKLKSNDSTLWRRQIKQAVPLYKKKGTISALKEALDQAGIKLTKITKLWQVISEYSWIDSFVKNGLDKTIGSLSKSPIDMNDIDIKIKASEGKEFLSIPKKCVEFIRVENDLVIKWVSEEVSLYDGDLILVKYKIKQVPAEKQTLENYIQSLPLADNRDPTAQKYPLKNWNIRLLEEDDPLFDVIVQTRHPVYDPVVYGKVRTTFLYSEKVYNMDTYNGSLRDSQNPYDLDKYFVDKCSYCQSGKFNIDIEIESLSNERIDEVKEIVEEYVPFHASLNFININNTINELVVSPVETIENLIDKDTVTDLVKHQEKINYTIEYANSKEIKQGAI